MGDNESIKVICRVRPLNKSEEAAGSKFVLKFPSDESIGIGVSPLISLFISICIGYKSLNGVFNLLFFTSKRLA